MKVLQINAVYGHGSTGTIVRDIEHLCEQNGIECYVASPDPNVREAKRGYVVGNVIDHKLHALLCRINGMQAYYSHFPTWDLCRYIDQINPDVIHLHNLHSNYIHLNILLKHLAKRDIKTVITLHDCWFYTGGCFHYTSAGCGKWMTDCDNCPKKKLDTPAFLKKKSARILADRKRYLLAIPNLNIVGVSNWITSEAKKSFLKEVPVKTIYNGIDLSIFKPTLSNIRNELELSGKIFLLGPASKWLSPVNEAVLQYFVDRLGDNERLVLFGSHSTVSPSEKVLMYGYTSNTRELAELYTAADVFVNCTREESLGLINIEAQACGTPVVSFSATGCGETILQENMVSPGDAVSLYTKSMTTQKTLIDIHKYDRRITYKSYIELYRGLSTPNNSLK